MKFKERSSLKYKKDFFCFSLFRYLTGDLKLQAFITNDITMRY